MKKMLMMVVAACLTTVSALAGVTITTSAKTFDKSGGPASVTVTGSGSWTATSDSSWLTVRTGASGDGAGTVVYVVSANSSADVRIGHIDIGGNVYTVTQNGYPATLSPSSVTVDRKGGSGTVSITVDAGIAWTARPDVDWLSVTPTSGKSVGTVTYTVSAHPGVVTRNGTITIAGQPFSVTQTGVDVSIAPAEIHKEPEADIVQVTITALATTKWTVQPNASWISIVDKPTGYGDYVLTLGVNANPSFARRTGTVNIGTDTLTIVQDGLGSADLVITPETAAASPSGAYGNVAVYATPDAPWTAESLTPWLTISEGQAGAGNGNIKYVASANPTLSPREGVIRITPPYKTPDPDLMAGLVCQIPAFSATDGGAERFFQYRNGTTSLNGNWSEMQKALNTTLPITSYTCSIGSSGQSWDGFGCAYFNGDGKELQFSVVGSGELSFWARENGGNDAGCQKMGYCVDGVEQGNLCRVGWSKRTINITGSGQHSIRFYTWADGRYYGGCVYDAAVDNVVWKPSVSQSQVSFDGTSAATLCGAGFEGKGENSFSTAFSFAVAELGRVNRLMSLAGSSIWIDTENHLVIDGVATSYVVQELDRYYTMLVRQTDEGLLSVYAGEQGGELENVLEMDCDPIIDFSKGEVSPGIIKFGYADRPTSGFLTDGKVKNFRFWNRALSDDEAEIADINDGVFHDSAPAVIPTGMAWNYMPLDGDWLASSSASATPKAIGKVLNGETATCEDRYGIGYRAATLKDDLCFYIEDFRSLFASSEPSATYNLWFRLPDLPESGNLCSLMNRIWSGATSYAANDLTVDVSITPEGAVRLNNNGTAYDFAEGEVEAGAWYMLSLVGTATKTLQVYLNGVEIGNVSSAVSLGYAPATSYGSEANFLRARFGIGVCDLDEFTIYHGVVPSAQIRELYEMRKARIVYHTVTQGIQTAKLSETEKFVDADGANESVNLTLAQLVNWEIVENCNWIHVTSDKNGAGSAVVNFTVDSNDTVTNRFGTLTIAGVTLTVEQEGLMSTVSCDKTFFNDVSSDWGTLSVDTEGGGKWLAQSNCSWIHFLDGDTYSGTGAEDVWFIIDDYDLTTQSRTGSITIAGETVYITQCGYKLSIDPAVADVGSNAGAGEIGVAASIDQLWDVICDCDWIQIISARTGLGDGKVQYTFTDNTTGMTRTGTIIIGGQKYTLTQRTTLPLVTKTNGEGTIAGAGQYSQGTAVTLTATPKNGYVFSHWQGDAVGVENAVTVTMDIAKTVEAVFIPESAAEQLAAAKAAQGGFYTRDQIHNLEVGNLVLDVDSATGKARIGVRLQETSDLSNPNWQPVEVSAGDLDVGNDGTVGISATATGNAKFYRVVTPVNSEVSHD